MIVKEIGVEKIAIIGTGLIGTSLGLAIRRAYPKGVLVVGTDIEHGRASRAKKLGALDRSEIKYRDAVHEADLVFITTPVKAIREVMETIAPDLREGCLVSDTGSTKVEVMKWAAEILPKAINFVGGHPMAGKENSGPEHADLSLFTGRPYCIIPDSRARAGAVQRLVDLVKAIGARPILLDTVEHDSYVAAASHLPLLISVALVRCTSRSPAWGDIAQIASTGYRDLTRLASGDPVMHRDICVTNGELILGWIDRFVEEMHDLRKQVADGADSVGAQLEETFVGAQYIRNQWLDGRVNRGAGPSTTYSDMPTFSENMAQAFLGSKGMDAYKRFKDDNTGKSNKTEKR